MSDNKNIDKIKGRGKEAAGAITDDEELKEEGRNDQRAGEAKDKVDKAADKVKDGVDSVKRRLSN